MSWTLQKIAENSFYGIFKEGVTHCMSWNTFEQIGKARRAAELSRTGIKVIVRDGVSYLFPDGHKMSIASTIDLKPETIGAWLACLYAIRKERNICKKS